MTHEVANSQPRRQQHIRRRRLTRARPSCQYRTWGSTGRSACSPGARRRVRRERVEHLVELGSGDVLALPFEDDRFDVVLCESVLAFVEDKPAAIRECVRVTKPGGHVGLNEGLWLTDPPPDLVERLRDAIGPSVPTEAAWRRLWADSGLTDRTIEIRRVDARTEIRSRIQWIGWRWILGAWRRALWISLTNPAMRQSIKQQLDVPLAVFDHTGYGLFTGRKAPPGDHENPV